MIRQSTLRLLLLVISVASFFSYLVSRLHHPKPAIPLVDQKYRSIHSHLLQHASDYPTKSINEKCASYFNALMSTDGDWTFTKKIGANYPHTNVEKSEDIIHLNVFNRCFIDSIDKTAADYKLLKNWNIESRMYPYLSGNLPEITDSKYNLIKLKYDESLPYWTNYKRNIIKGKGIVISISDAFVPDLLLLLQHLRDLHNELPIQFVHRGDLSSSNIRQIINTATVQRHNHNLPKQNVFFVNVAPVLSDDYREEFKSYFNKLLAYAFNTFEEVIVLDTDVVLFTNPKSLFQTKNYKISNTLFFKDRNTEMRMSDAYVQFLKETSMNEFDNLLFNGPFISHEYWDNEYFKMRYFHYMESGVVVINRAKYWNGMVLSLQLPYIQSLAIASWGDKEYFWLSLLLAGYDTFKFNTYWTATVGKVIEKGKGMPKKICSGHPAHILDETDELIWINSGILNCPKNDPDVLNHDFQLLNKQGDKRFGSVSDLQKYYLSPISFDAFVIPPVYELGLSTLEKTPFCKSYIWCASEYSTNIHSTIKVINKGKFKTFSKQQVQKYTNIGQQYFINYKQFDSLEFS